jgi:hypothetical protein
MCHGSMQAHVFVFSVDHFKHKDSPGRQAGRFGHGFVDDVQLQHGWMGLLVSQLTEAMLTRLPAPLTSV